MNDNKSNENLIKTLLVALLQQLQAEPFNSEPSNAEPSKWLQTAQSQLESSSNNEERFERFLRFSAMCKRKVGNEPLQMLPNWHCDQVARLALLNQLLQFETPVNQAARVKAAFKFGDESEQIAIIKGLNLLPCASELVDLAIATGRTNSLNLFAAIALNNDFAAQYYQSHAYHQLVLKALFMDMDISQMVGLKAHWCPELSGLAIDLVNERIAAGRKPPGGIDLAIDPEHLNSIDLVTYKQL